LGYSFKLTLGRIRELIENTLAGIDQLEKHGHSDIDLYEASDVTGYIPEGQNLQDSNSLGNNNIPWNSVRLIQCLGRIDRKGGVNMLGRQRQQNSTNEYRKKSSMRI